MGARETFERIRKRKWCPFQRGVLVETISSIESATLGDLMACLDDSAYVLDDDDDLRVGELLGRPGEGPTVVDVLQQLDLPLANPIDDATAVDMAIPLASFLSSDPSLLHRDDQLCQHLVG